MTLWRTYPDLYREMEDFRRRVESLFYGAESPTRTYQSSQSSWPRANVSDRGESFVLEAELPGMTTDDVSVDVTQDSLTITGARKVDRPQDYSVHRKERPVARFARSFSFPVKVDPEKVNADLKNGLLTVTLSKQPEHKPRTISVKAG